jgi:hypothetical protein
VASREARPAQLENAPATRWPGGFVTRGTGSAVEEVGATDPRRRRFVAAARWTS